MRIKSADGHESSVTGQGQGNLNTVLGAIGTYGALNSGALGGLLGGVMGGCGNGWNRNGCGCGAVDVPISRYEAAMMQEIAAKDGKIALLEANEYTNQKEVEVYRALHGEIKELAAEVRQNKASQDAVNLQQATLNAANTAALGCMQGQIQQLFGLTKLVVPNASVCPGWGNVTITPAAAPTTTAGA